jgi:hypothetical protein
MSGNRTAIPIPKPDESCGSGMVCQPFCFLPFENRTGHFLTTSLDHFIIKYFLFMTTLLIKQSRLVDYSKTRQIRPVFEWSAAILFLGIRKTDRFYIH